MTEKKTIHPPPDLDPDDEIIPISDIAITLVACPHCEKCPTCNDFRLVTPTERAEFKRCNDIDLSEGSTEPPRNPQGEPNNG